jgi:methyl-accepting chemotaxis protein
MRKWTIGRRIVVGFSVVTAIVFLLGAFAYTSLTTISKEVTTIADQSLPGLSLSAQMVEEAHRRFELVLEHVIANDEATMIRLEGQIKELDAKIETLMQAYEAKITTAQDRENFSKIRPAAARIGRIRNELLLPLDHAGKEAEAQQVVRTQLRPAIEAYMQAVDAVFEYNKRGGDEASGVIRQQVASAKAGVMIALLLSVVISVAIALVIVKTTGAVLGISVQELTAGAGQVAAAAEQLSGAAQSMSQDASSQAAALEETSASMEEMASMTRQNAENSHQGAQLMGQVDKHVSESERVLQGMVTSMQGIQESTSKVSRIIKTVDEIAFQTNILALNAAVEAARAGEAGMGFAVVADEVRNLAQRALQAAKDTSSLIETAISNAQEGDRRVREVAESITAISGSVGQAKRLVDEVSAASLQQTQGIDQVSKAILELEQLTQRTAANSEESAAASEELSSQAEVTMSVVARLNELVGARARQFASQGTGHDEDPMPMPPRQPSGKVVPWTRSNAA